MSGFEILGVWVAIALTFMLLSFLYDDNPIYKLAEHIFLGVSIGVATLEAYYGNFRPHLIDKFRQLFDWSSLTWNMGAEGDPHTTFSFIAVPTGLHEQAFGTHIHLWLYFIPLVLVILLFSKLDPKRSWLARIPISILVAAYAGVKLTGDANGNLMKQVAQSMPDLRKIFAENLHEGTETTIKVFRPSEGFVPETVVGTCTDTLQSWYNGIWCLSNDGDGIFSSLVLVIGLICSLIYFYFGSHDRGIIKTAGQVGIWTLMVAFGASFGFTVMGRISLAIGRAEVLLGYNLLPEQSAQVHPQIASVVLGLAVVAGLVVWRIRNPLAPSDDSGPPPGPPKAAQGRDG